MVLGNRLYTLFIFLVSDNYQYSGDYNCINKACYWSDYDEFGDFGIYDTSDPDCSLCEERCSKDPDCGAVECGSTYSSYCSWWAPRQCAEGDLQEYQDAYTCYKGE